MRDTLIADIKRTFKTTNKRIHSHKISMNQEHLLWPREGSDIVYILKSSPLISWTRESRLMKGSRPKEDEFTDEWTFYIY